MDVGRPRLERAGLRRAAPARQVVPRQLRERGEDADLFEKTQLNQGLFDNPY